MITPLVWAQSYFFYIIFMLSGSIYLIVFISPLLQNTLFKQSFQDGMESKMDF